MIFHISETISCASSAVFRPATSFETRRFDAGVLDLPWLLIAQVSAQAVAAAQPFVPLWARDAPWQWWAGGATIELGPRRQTLESFWYGQQYMLGSMSRPCVSRH